MIIFCSLFILIIFKAKNTEITVDEAYSFLNYSYVGDYLNIGIANNHILNSYLMYLFQNIGYSELFFTEKLWPEFNKDDFVNILQEFNQRQRRFGK